MTPLKALLLGILEGLTEFLPVSSTGHLVLLSHWLGTDGSAQQKAYADAFDIVIQLGALFAVLVHYRKLLAERLVGVLKNDAASLALVRALAIAFLPGAIVGFALHKRIEAALFFPKPIAIALIAGGVLMIAVELVRKRRHEHGLDGLEHVTPARALAIGIGQCFSLVPGTSRSMATIVAGQLTGLSTATAAEFSFLLALPTLGAATLYKLAKSRHELLDMPNGTLSLTIGMLTSFVVAWAVIAAFLRYLKRWGLTPFGIYRILLGVAVLLLLAR